MCIYGHTSSSLSADEIVLVAPPRCEWGVECRSLKLRVSGIAYLAEVTLPLVTLAFPPSTNIWYAVIGEGVK